MHLKDHSFVQNFCSAFVRNSRHGLVFPFMLAFLQLGFAGPVTTVPWNGYKGAVSFTFDDACGSQVTNVLPALSSRGIHATFFIPAGANFDGNRATWIQAAQDGNELANHTIAHSDLSSLDSAAIAEQVKGQAESLRNLDPSIEALTLAYPYCNTNDLVDRITETENIIARTCGGNAQFSWSSQPSNWMRMTSHIVSDAASHASAMSGLDQAAQNQTWFVTLNHGVGGDWMSVESEKVAAMFDKAIEDSLWIATYQDVAAYWRASFTMDAVQAQTVEKGWHLSWTSPHPRMPRSVILRVKLDTLALDSSLTVSQKGKELSPEADGTYLVEFMDLELDVFRQASLSSQKNAFESSIQIRRQGRQVRLSGISSGEYAYWMNDLSGRVVSQGNISVTHEEALLSLPKSGQAYILRLSPMDRPSHSTDFWLPISSQ